MSCTTTEQSRFADKQLYGTYRQRIQDTCGVLISFPDSLIVHIPQFDDPAVFTFASNNNYDSLAPLYYAGPIVRLDMHCNIILPDYKYMSRYRSGEFPMYIDDTLDARISPFVAMMIYNLGLPWSKAFFEQKQNNLFYDSQLSVQNKTKSKMLQLTNEDKDEILLNYRYNINTWNSKITDSLLTKQSNSDSIFIVRIVAPVGVTCTNQQYEELFIKGGWACYGVEFFRSDRNCFMGMFILVDKQAGKSIDDYVEEISRYIYFDPNFKY